MCIYLRIEGVIKNRVIPAAEGEMVDLICSSGHFGMPPSYLKYFVIAFYSIRWYLDTIEGKACFPFGGDERLW